MVALVAHADVKAPDFETAPDPGQLLFMLFDLRVVLVELCTESLRIDLRRVDGSQSRPRGDDAGFEAEDLDPQPLQARARPLGTRRASRSRGR